MATAPAPMATMAEVSTMIMSEASFSSTPTDDGSHAASLSSTPPTTVSPDSVSLASEPDMTKPDRACQNDVYVSGAAALEAVIPILESQNEQQLSGQQSPVELDAIVVAQPLPSINFLPTSRSRRARAGLPMYNIATLSSTSLRRKPRVKGGSNQEKRRQGVSGDAGLAVKTAQAVAGGSQSPKGARISSRTKPIPVVAPATRRATRLSGAVAETLATKVAALAKGKKKNAKLPKLPRELRRLRDTDEFAHIDSRPVKYTVWSNGKFVDVTSDPAAAAAVEPRQKKTKVETEAADGIAAEARNQEKKEDKKAEAAPARQADPGPFSARRTRHWHKKGLYAGQEAPSDLTVGLTAAEKKQLAAIPALAAPGKPNKTMPLPMYAGMRTLIAGRDFKLPLDVCNPMPPGHPKPPPYRTLTKNRFVGDAAAYWKKSPHFDDFSSKCVCKPQDGCAEDCQNRIMLYECDETNCNAGKEFCTNRAFQDLAERTKKGGPYRVGVEVVKTENRGFGVRSNRSFQANQIIMEYTGEIITDAECERRMNEKYKDNECYYLMSFDQNMIIDATTGSMARFVNHSCSPNCRMIKWIVSGQPRMALFAGDREIQTGEELTYDYNFDPFSAKNVQKCLCGSANCRGVLGPKPKEVKQPKAPKEEKKPAANAAKGKRKLAELVAGSKEEEKTAKPAKKQKVKPAAGIQRTVSTSKSLKSVKSAAKGATTMASKKLATVAASQKNVKMAAKKTVKAAAKGKGVAQVAAKTIAAKSMMAAKSVASKRITKPATKAALTASKRSSGTISLGAKTALKPSSKGSSSPKPAPTTAPASASATVSSARKRTPSRKALEASTPDAGNTPAPATSSAKSSLSRAPRIRLVSSTAAA
ncbi:hypothetical protein QBC35DRAFT_514374 [Podospora australis]|uniref:Histone-lysine N-methyltransferase n=1 Tax=Podospora australis TaxID=1536484 RepID=A0AAN6WX66_9PEZI|nr:hypothetical protein QBC35DRAFT_514374 [Podospora australis]